MKPSYRVVIITLFIASLALFLNFMSIGLDDFDSFAFALGIEHWDKALLVVHPPGFPVYIFWGKILQLVVHDTRLALTLLSAICGALGIILTAYTGKALGQAKAGILAALLLVFLPGYWINSELALSDIPGVMFSLLAIVFLLRTSVEKRHRRNFVIGCFFAGLSLGVRPHNAIPIALAGLYALYQLRHLKREQVMTIVAGFAAGIIALSLWLIPVYNTFNGFEGYINRLNEHGQHIETSDSLFRQSIDVQSIQMRVDAFVEGWNHVLAGDDWQAFPVILVLILIGLIRVPIRTKYVRFALLWLIADGAKIFLLASLERPRLFLPALTPLILLVASGYMQWSGRLKFVRLGIIALLGIFLWQSTPLIAILSQVAPSPERATAYVLENYPLDKGTALVVSQGSFEAAQYHLGAYPQLYTPKFDAVAWSENVAYNQPDYLIVLDGDDVAPEIFDALTSELQYVQIDDRVFERSARVFPQHVTVRLQVFVQEKNLQASQLALPDDGQLQVGDANFSKYFGAGWYRTEDIAGTSARWATDQALIRVALKPEDTQMTFVSAPYSAGQSVEVTINRVRLTSVVIDSVWGTTTVSIPAALIQGHAITTIELDHALAEYPENSNRKLSAAYSLFKFDG